MKKGISLDGLVATINTTREKDARDIELGHEPTEERLCIYDRGTSISIARYFKPGFKSEFLLDFDAGISFGKMHVPHLFRALTLALLPKESRAEAIQDLVDALVPRGEEGPGSGT